LKGFIANKPTIFSHPLFINLEEDGLPISKPINRNKLLIYLQILLGDVGCHFIGHGLQHGENIKVEYIILSHLVELSIMGHGAKEK
jgi:hypothetical protein